MPIKACKKYCMIALNDGAENVPKLLHENVDIDAPMVVITHKNSIHHRDPTASLNAYGGPQLGIAFSHLEDKDTIFDETKECFKVPSKARDFAQKHRTHFLYRTWDQLAALFQLKLLQNEPERSGWGDLETEFLSKIKRALLPVQREELNRRLHSRNLTDCFEYARVQGDACCPK